MWSMRTVLKPSLLKVIGVSLATVVALAAAYYFAISLPAYNRARLEQERAHFKALEDAEQERIRAEEERAKAQAEAAKVQAEAAAHEETARKEDLARCYERAESAATDWFHAHSFINREGQEVAYATVLAQVDAIRANGIARCNGYYKGK